MYKQERRANREMGGKNLLTRGKNDGASNRRRHLAPCTQTDTCKMIFFFLFLSKNVEHKARIDEKIRRMDNSNFYHIPNAAVGARHPINSRQPFVVEVAAVGGKAGADRAWGVSLLPEKGNDFPKPGSIKDPGTTIEVHLQPERSLANESGLKWIAGAEDEGAADETPVKSYENFQNFMHATTEELGHAAHKLVGDYEELGQAAKNFSCGIGGQRVVAENARENYDREMVIAEQDIEARLMSGRLQSLRCQLEVQRQTSTKLSKMCKQNKEEYERCVKRLTEEGEAERLRAYSAEQELKKRIQVLEQSRDTHSQDKTKPSYVSIHGFASSKRREVRKEEEYVGHLETDAARLRQKVADLTSSLSKANVRGVKAEKLLENARTEYRTSLNTMRQAQAELQNGLEDKEILIQALRNESDTRMWGVDKIRAQYHDLELDRARLQRECEQLKVAAAQYELDSAQMQVQFQKLNQDSKELDDRNVNLKQQV